MRHFNWFCLKKKKKKKEIVSLSSKTGKTSRKEEKAMKCLALSETSCINKDFFFLPGLSLKSHNDSWETAHLDGKIDLS